MTATPSMTATDVVASFERDGTAALWRGLWEGLTDDDRARLVAEWRAGDRLAALILSTLDKS